MVTAGALFEAAVQAKAHGDGARAEALYRDLLNTHPETPEAWVNLANLIAARGDWATVADCLNHVPEEHDLYAAAQRNLGLAYREMGQLGNAIATLDAVLTAAPDDRVTQVALAHVLSAQAGILRATTRTAEAVALAARAVALIPDDPALIANLALCHLWNGAPQMALDAYEQALAQDPNDDELAYARATLLLSLGRWADGWTGFERRLDCADTPLTKLASDAPMWDGTPKAGQTLLLWTEQGLGDTVQFLRFAGRIKAMGMRVVLACRKGLLPLLAASPLVDAAVDIAASLPPHDLRLPLMSLPDRLGLVSAPDLAADTPYLAADPARVERWTKRLGSKSGLRVGLCWRGSPRNDTDAVRSIPLRTLLNGLSGVPDVEYLSLQVGPGTEQADGLAAVRSLGADFDADPDALFMDAAAVIAGLDAVVTVDTAIAHVAGALGVPVLLLLSAVPDWRWGHDGDRTPWYPSMRLYRQLRLGDWSVPLAALKADLQALGNR